MKKSIYTLVAIVALSTLPVNAFAQIVSKPTPQGIGGTNPGPHFADVFQAVLLYFGL